MKTEKFETFISLMKENWPEANEVMMFSFPLIDRIQALNENARAKVMAGYDLQTSDFGLLTALRRSAKPYRLTPTQLRERMLISSGGLTKALYRLEDKGMISRSASPEDGRIKLVQLTEKGRLTIEDAAMQSQDIHKKMKAEFSDEEVKQLDKLLEKLLYLVEKE